MDVAVACLLAYLLGGVPFGLLLARLLAGVDIRRIGSGNVGATNAARAFSTRPKRLGAFLLIYLLDGLKGYVPTAWFGAAFGLASPNAPVFLGCCALLGHCFTPYLRFKGGKGVATGCGVFAALEPLALLIALAAFGLAYAATRKVFVGSLTLGVALALAVVFRDPSSAFAGRTGASVFAIAVALFLFFTHRSNLRQALRGATA